MNKQISFKRQIKFFWKEIQRNYSKRFLDDKKIWNFPSTEDYKNAHDSFLNRGVILYGNDINHLRLMKADKFKRTSKLIKRLGKAALKQKSVVYYSDIRNCVNCASDARAIPFYKTYKIVEQKTTERIVFAINQQHLDQGRYRIRTQNTLDCQTTITQI